MKEIIIGKCNDFFRCSERQIHFSIQLIWQSTHSILYKIINLTSSVYITWLLDYVFSISLSALNKDMKNTHMILIRMTFIPSIHQNFQKMSKNVFLQFCFDIFYKGLVYQLYYTILFKYSLKHSHFELNQNQPLIYVSSILLYIFGSAL